MVYKLSANIEIGKWNFTNVSELEINETTETLTDTCTIQLPRRLQWRGKPVVWGTDPIIKRGDKVVVKLGYNNKLFTRFIGYVSTVKSGTPIQITCEDSMFLLKKDAQSISFSGISLSGLISKLVPAGIKTKVADGIELGTLRINKSTPAQVLEQLKQKYGLYSYFRIIDDKPVLYCGLKYWGDNTKKHSFKWNWGIIQNNLEFRKEEDIKLKVKAISLNKNNTKTEYECGDADGELRTVFAYNVSADSLKIFAQNQLEALKYTGFSGSFTTDGEQCVRKGDSCNIDGDQDTQSGIYLVQSVKSSWGSNGYRQQVELGSKA